MSRHPRGIVCVKFRSVEECEAAILRLNGRIYRHLGLPDREVELTRYYFIEKHQLCESDGYSAESGKMTLESLNEQQLDLLKRVDVFIEAIKLCESLQREDTKQTTGRRRQMDSQMNSCWTLEDIHVIEPSLIAQLSHHDFNLKVPTQECDYDLNVASGGWLNNQASHIIQRYHLRQKLAYFIANHPLVIEAYIYDGKTDLKGQISEELPKCESKKIKLSEEEPREEEKNHIEKETIVETSKTSWEEWLKGDSSDSDSSDFEIHREE